MLDSQLYSGTGKLLGRRIIAGQVAGAFRSFGNATSFETTPKMDTYKHRSNSVPSRPVDYVLNHNAELGCKFTVEDFSQGNIAMVLLGKEFTQVSTAVTDKAIATDAKAGQLFDLGSPFAVVDSVSVAGTPVADTEYVVHKSGLISFKADQTGAITWTGSTSDTVNVSALADTNYTLELIFDGLNAFGGEPLVIRGTVSISPGDAVQFLSTEATAQALTVSGECLWDESINGGLAPGFLRITRKAA